MGCLMHFNRRLSGTACACAAALAIIALTAATDVAGQGRGAAAGQGRGGGAPQTAKQAAPVDITGTWVSIVSEDWRWRMVTPPKGDVARIPVNGEARKIAASWNLEADHASGNQRS